MNNSSHWLSDFFMVSYNKLVFFEIMSADTQGSPFGIMINSDVDASWEQMAGSLPEQITINDVVYKTSDLEANTRKLIAIYLADQRIIGNQKELLALAELGLKAIVSEIENSLPAL